MKKVTIYYNTQTGEVVVEHVPTLDKMEIFEAMATGMRIVFQQVMEIEARKRDIDANDMEKIARLMAKQKEPKMN